MDEQVQRQAPHASGDTAKPRGARSALILGASGVVFGDIGTSPLYTMHETFLPEHGLFPLPHTVLGILSMISRSLIVVVAVKYVSLVVRADNKGGGGIMALMTLARQIVYLHATQCLAGHGLFPDSRQPADRAGCPGGDLDVIPAVTRVATCLFIRNTP